jgi:calcineurin-like phosphoesterase family protein
MQIENTWVVADTHWGHNNIVRFCDRPAGHDRLMVARWAETVPADGVVLHLGDLMYRGGRSWFRDKIAPQLTGREKLLLKGNHDKQTVSYYASCGFKVVEPFSIPYGNGLVEFDHYPYPSDEKAPKNVLRVHGHIHTNGYARGVPTRERHVNVGAEVLQYRPANLGTLLKGYFS